MVTKLKEVDVVVVGLGWTGGILSKELAEAGLKVVALERGSMRSTSRAATKPACGRSITPFRMIGRMSSPLRRQRPSPFSSA